MSFQPSSKFNLKLYLTALWSVDLILTIETLIVAINLDFTGEILLFIIVCRFAKKLKSQSEDKS